MIISQALASTAEHADEHNLFQDPTFWVAIAFFITLAALVKLAGKAISGTLQGRANKIAAELNEAAKLRAEAQSLLAEYADRHEKMEKTTKEALKDAEEKAQKMKENLQKDFEEKLKKREEATETRLNRAMEEASEEIRSLAVTIAMQAVEKYLSEKLSDEEGQRLIDEAIDSLPEIFSQKNVA